MISWEELPRSMTKVGLHAVPPRRRQGVGRALEVAINLALPQKLSRVRQDLRGLSLGHKGITIAGPRHRGTSLLAPTSPY